MQGTSYTLTDFTENPPDDVDVWEENWMVLMLFKKYSTQWRAGMGGAFALDMNVFQHELTRKKVPDATFDTMIEQLSVIEGEALKWLHRK